MSMEGIDESSADVPGEPTEINSTSAPIEPAELAPEAAADTTSKWGLNRRKFLTAAALGTAAAALLNKGSGGYLSLGPASALADDHSTDPCTAGDIAVGETGIILNEPCICTAGEKFNAVVQFQVTNKTGTGRYCMALHLPSAGGVASQDVILYTTQACAQSGGGTGCSSTVPANSTITMYGLIKGVPCSAGKVCFSTGTPNNRGKCSAPNTCVTVAFSTSPNAAGCTLDSSGNAPNFPNGQCRHQQICIVGFGATLTCTAGCTPACGGEATLKACVTADASRGPFTFTLNGSDGSTQTQSGVAGDSSGTTCVNFTVTVTKDTTYTLTVTDKDGCTRTAQTSLSATPVAKPTLSRTGSGCDGNATITVTNCDASLTYTWYDNGVLISGASGCSLTKQFAPGSHSITVTASNAGGTCTATSDANVFTVNPPVTLSLDDFVQTNCTGNGSFTAHASGGADGYTFTWEIDGSTVSGVTGDTLSYTAKLDGTCHMVSVSVTDSAGCPSTPASVTKSISQCVQTTAC
jgi:hypothetical protein